MATLVLTDPRTGDLRLSPERRWDRTVARLRSTALDRRLAAGERPESSRSLAARARMLVTPASRRAVARDWDHAVGRAGRPTPGRGRRVRPRHDQVAAARADLDRAGALLRAPFPAGARGVAMLAVLLTDGTGPLFNPHAAIDLATAVRDAVSQLDPGTAMVPA